MECQYKIVLNGLLPGFPPETAKQNLANLFKTAPEQVERILAAKGFTVKRGLPQVVAAKYQQAIAAAGAHCVMEMESPVAPGDLDFSDTAAAPPPLPEASTPPPVPVAASDGWHYELNGARLGPADEAEMSSMIAAGTLGRGSFVWQKGMPDWTPLEATPFASQLAHTPPPLIGEAVNNTLVWLLAFAPAIGLFATGFLAGMTGRSVEEFEWTTVVVNVVLSILDAKQLQKAGHDTSKMGMAWLVPVYLFKRAKVLKQNNAYFIVWVVLFVLSLYGAL